MNGTNKAAVNTDILLLWCVFVCVYITFFLSVIEIISLDYYVPLPREIGSVGVCVCVCVCVSRL